MKRTLKFLLIFFGLIIVAFVIGGSYFQGGILEDITSPAAIERLENLEKNSSQVQEKIEFISPENKLSFRYSSDWKEIADKEILQKLSLEDEENDYYFEVIFFAQKLQPNQILIANKSLLNVEKPQDVIDIMIELNSKDSSEMKVINRKKEGSEIIIEAEYKDRNNNIFHSIEKILVREAEEEEREVFIVAIVVPKENWNGPTEEINKIIESAKLINDN